MGDDVMTNVIHIHEAPHGWQHDPQFVYIGRYNSRYGLQKSIWHNPYKINDINHLPLNEIEKRANVINKFAAYLEYQPQLLSRLPELEDKTLVCYCSPQACHGDILCHWLPLLQRLAMESARYHPSHAIACQTLEQWMHPTEPPGLEFFDDVEDVA